jgi:putative nucleotidyltransferase with HDIG domain
MSWTDSLHEAQQAERDGRWDVALQAYQAALAGLGEAGTAGEIAPIHRRIGVVHAQRGHFEPARESYEVGLRIAEGSGLQGELARTLLCMANLEQYQGRLAEADTLYTRSRRVAEQTGDNQLLARVDQNLGTLANIQGDLETALRCYQSSLDRYLALDDELAAARALNCMAMAHLDLEKWDEAEACFDRAFALADRARDVNTLGGIEINRAELYIKRGAYDRARESCDGAFEIFGRLESQTGLAEVYKIYGVLFRQTGKPVLADTHFKQAIELAKECRVPLLEAETLNEWALAHLVQERNSQALFCLNSAHRTFSELHARRELLDLDARLDGLEATYLKVVQSWGESIESNDRYTAGHCERVANYACLLAEAVGIEGRDLTWMRMGGYLHDVGKIAIPPEVLNKPGKLTPEEWALMQTHTVEGDAIVAELNFPWDIRPIVRSHHERWDGSGYPDGLKGEEIPLTARILCLADVYDALRTTRSYRAALSVDESFRIMAGDVGRIFDPSLFPVFEALIRQVIPVRDGRFPAFEAPVIPPPSA